MNDDTEIERKRKHDEELNAKLNTLLRDTKISDALRKQIMPYADKKSLTVLAKHDVAVVLTDRFEYGSSGGCAYYDQVRVFCGDQNEAQEWQWRDRYSAGRDRHDLKIYGLGEIEVSKVKEMVTVKVVLKNAEHGDRTATFNLGVSKINTRKTLSSDEQISFAAKIEKEMNRIMTELNHLWKLKPTMPSDFTSDYVKYKLPSIIQMENRSEIGVVAFVTEEQIDHRVNDHQIRYVLYLLTDDMDCAKQVAEDHGYEREGGAFLKIVEIKFDRITISTKGGKAEINF